MEKKMVFMERLFCVLSIIFYIIGLILLIINCFTDVLFYICFVYIFAFIFFINQLFFVPGKVKVRDRDYKNNMIYQWQFYSVMAILAAFLSFSFIQVSDQVYIAVLGGLLMVFLVLFAIQNIIYTYHFDKNNTLHFKRSLFFSIFFTAFLLIFLLYSFVINFRGYYV